MIDLLQVRNAKPELPSSSNVPWLAKEQVLRRIVMKFVVVRCDALGDRAATRKARPVPAASFQSPRVRCCP